ncbi:PepSY domain-containing protein [Chthonobacter albigriseus]|uniref:PepSY domain-containing protein n=1 Tax=Chthonobacter albigriseus TaxID=1683161 RepID=UPI0015EF5D47|nr:PepSY domain-containing protein [Chthonobacter albigriseus]
MRSAIATLMIMAAVGGAQAGPIADSVAQVPVSLPAALDVVTATIGSKITHLEFESRDGVPTYEFIVETAADVYYVGVSGTTGLVTEVDVIADDDDARFKALAKISEDDAKAAAMANYKGEVEEVKRLLLSDGTAAFEVDVEITGAGGEYNVYVDAASGKVKLVNVEYWELGETVPGDAD